MSIKKNIVYNVSLSVLNVLFPIITAPYISRVLGVENVGVIRFVMTNVGFFALFAALGIGYYGVRELAKYKDDQAKCSQIFSSLFAIVSCSTLVVALLFVLFINLIPEFREHRLLFSLYGITLYLVPITMDWYFQAKENFRMIAIRSFVVKLLALVGLFIFVRERGDVVPYILISVFSVVATQIWNLSYAYRTGLHISFRNLELRKHIKPMFVFLLSNIAISIFVMIDTVMLGFLSSYEQVGYFTSPNVLLVTITSCFVAINIVLLPRLSFNNTQMDDNTNTMLLQKTFDLNALLIIPLAVGLSLIASRFVPLFFGSEFAGSIMPMQILSFRVIVVMINCFFAHNILMAFGHEKKILLTASCAAVASFACNLLLIPHYGAIGAAVASIIAESSQAGLILYFVYKITKIRVRWSAMGVAAFFTLPFFALYYLCNMLVVHDTAFLFVFVSLSAIVYFALQLLTKNYLVQKAMEIGINKLKDRIGRKIELEVDK